MAVCRKSRVLLFLNLLKLFGALLVCSVVLLLCWDVRYATSASRHVTSETT